MSQKNAWSCFLAITPLWKGVGRKVGGVSKTSGNSLCDRHKNFPNWRSWEAEKIESKMATQPKKSWKNFSANHIENFLNF